ncbi:MAG TPA: acyl transferase, partial [Saprospiraceae bacterium]|nr:acyl transferase [Saprospiraceae bacterium]
TMRILLREVNDPFSLVPFGKTGLINVIDLANLDSCSFIATDDIGRLVDHQRFEVLGRYDQSDVRGCNLMVSDL